LAAQVVGQLFDKKVAHFSSVLFHPQGEEKEEAKLLILMGEMRLLSRQLTNSGSGHASSHAFYSLILKCVGTLIDDTP